MNAQLEKLHGCQSICATQYLFYFGGFFFFNQFMIGCGFPHDYFLFNANMTHTLWPQVRVHTAGSESQNKTFRRFSFTHQHQCKMNAKFHLFFSLQRWSLSKALLNQPACLPATHMSNQSRIPHFKSIKADPKREEKSGQNFKRRHSNILNGLLKVLQTLKPHTAAGRNQRTRRTPRTTANHIWFRTNVYAAEINSLQNVETFAFENTVEKRAAHLILLHPNAQCDFK